MNAKTPLLVAGLVASLSLGSVAVADAASKSVHHISKSATNVATTTTPTVGQIDPDAAVLAKLVTAGTITQAQSDAILAALQAAHATRPQIGEGNDGPGFGPGVSINEDLTVITNTLGITAAQLQTDLAAGKSLATIAGSKTAALITALVAAETTEINARVTSGAITQAQATTQIAGLNTAITAAVNATPSAGGFGHNGHGRGPGGPGFNGDDQGAPLSQGAPLTPSN